MERVLPMKPVVGGLVNSVLDVRKRDLKGGTRGTGRVPGRDEGSVVVDED